MQTKDLSFSAGLSVDLDYKTLHHSHPYNCIQFVFNIFFFYIFIFFLSVCNLLVNVIFVSGTDYEL